MICLPLTDSLFKVLIIWPWKLFKALIFRYIEKEMAIHSSILAWEIPWTEEPVGCRESDMTNELNNSKGFSGMDDYPKQLYYKENNLFF